MYASRRRRIRSGGAIFVTEDVDFDILHPIGEVIMSIDPYFNPNTADGWFGTWEVINQTDYALTTTNIPIIAGMFYGDNKAIGTIDWDNLPLKSLVGTGTTTTDGTHHHYATLSTTENGGHNHSVSLYDNDSQVSVGHYNHTWWTAHWKSVNTSWNGAHTHSVYGNTDDAGSHSHDVTVNTDVGGYYDDGQEYHTEGKEVSLEMQPKRLFVICWKRTA